MAPLKQFLGTPAMKLTLSYVAILAIMSIGFSLVLYQFADHQLVESLVRQYHQYGPGGPGGDNPQFIPLEIQDTINAARQGLILKLVYFNLGIIITGSFLGYWLAKRTLRPIEQALEAQSRFTADASHELRTPLAVMRAEIEVARSDPRITKAEAVKLLDSNLEEVIKLHTLSDALLRLSQSNSKPIPLGPVSTAKVTTEALTRVAARAKSAGITTIDDTSDVTVLGDQHTLCELVVILLDNAIKYSPSGSVVTVGSRKSGNLGEISVRDQGRGIAAKDLSHIFERFYRADKSRTKADVDGHGLGLSIAKTIAEVHAGTIDVDSKPGKGSVFRVKLNLA